MEILYILYICNSRYCIVPQGLKKLQTEIAAFDKQTTEELDRLEQFREEELRKLRCVSFCPNEYQFSFTVIVTSDFLFRSQGPSALTSYRNDGTVSSNILLVNVHVWAFGRFSQLSISIAFIWHFTATKWSLFSHLENDGVFLFIQISISFL